MHYRLFLRIIVVVEDALMRIISVVRVTYGSTGYDIIGRISKNHSENLFIHRITSLGTYRTTTV